MEGGMGIHLVFQTLLEAYYGWEPGCWEEGKSHDHLIAAGATSASTP